MNKNKADMRKFLTILFLQALVGMEMDLFIPSLPQLQRVFDLNPFLVQMTVSVNFFAFSICSLFAGGLGDRYNRRTIVLGGLGLFVLGSFLCVIAPTFAILLLGRAIQGIGISAPAILSFPIMLEEAPSKDQPGIVGKINGVKTLAMAIAPYIGSMVNLYFNWRGNFTLLLGLGIFGFIISGITIPSHKPDETVSLSLRGYLPLLQSKAFLILCFGLTFLTSAYWLFLGMAPLLYIHDMGVSLQHFGYYQGSFSLTFALVSITSYWWYQRWGQERCFMLGMGICFISALLIFFLIAFKSQQPMLITAVIILFSLGYVFPINKLYPRTLEIVPHTKGRSAGLCQAIVMLTISIMLEVAGYFYNGQFTPIGIMMIISLALSFILIFFAHQKQWV